MKESLSFDILKNLVNTLTGNELKILLFKLVHHDEKISLNDTVHQLDMAKKTYYQYYTNLKKMGYLDAKGKVGVSFFCNEDFI